MRQEHIDILGVVVVLAIGILAAAAAGWALGELIQQRGLCVAGFAIGGGLSLLTVWSACVVAGRCDDGRS